MEDVVPFLVNITSGKNIPTERIRKVAEQYELFGGVSPINSYCRTLISALRAELLTSGYDLPIYWGNRNWHPLLSDAMQQMARDGVKRALAFITAAYESYSSYYQYLENIESARQIASMHTKQQSPEVDHITPYYNHPLFIESNTEHLLAALSEIPRHNTCVLFTAHSIPLSMAEACPYENQLREVCQQVADRAGIDNWELVFQSRSGSPSQPWLIPDINDYVCTIDESAVQNLVVMPIGFICDHMEVIYSLDVEAAQAAHSRGLNFIRAATAGTNRKFVHMIRDLILERTIKLQPQEAYLAKR